jgi:hypothetical protein
MIMFTRSANCYLSGSWFNVAASTALGYSPRGVLGDGYISEGGKVYVTVQYGSNVVAAKWLDLTKKIRVH